MSSIRGDGKSEEHNNAYSTEEAGFKGTFYWKDESLLGNWELVELRSSLPDVLLIIDLGGL